MSEVYAAEIIDGVVERVIVGTAEWASDRLGGTWINTNILVGIGWLWNPTDGFQPTEQ